MRVIAFHNSLAIVLLSTHGTGVSDIDLRSLRELGGIVLGIGTLIARFHSSSTTPSVIELLQMSHGGVASSGANFRMKLGQARKFTFCDLFLKVDILIRLQLLGEGRKGKLAGQFCCLF